MDLSQNRVPQNLMAKKIIFPYFPSSQWLSAGQKHHGHSHSHMANSQKKRKARIRSKFVSDLLLCLALPVDPTGRIRWSLKPPVFPVLPDPYCQGSSSSVQTPEMRWLWHGFNSQGETMGIWQHWTLELLIWSPNKTDYGDELHYSSKIGHIFPNVPHMS